MTSARMFARGIVLSSRRVKRDLRRAKEMSMRIWTTFSTLTPETYAARYRGSAMKRAKLAACSATHAPYLVNPVNPEIL